VKAGDKRKCKQQDGGVDDGDEVPDSSDGRDVALSRSKKAKHASAMKRVLPPLARSWSTIPSSDEDE
jgi:hypothetical protein